jgi:hypothetical protein
MVGRFSANLARGLTNKEIIMKRLLLILILVFAVMSASDARMSGVMLSGTGSTTAAPACADSSCTGFMFCQNFETATTGFDNSETWSTVGTVNLVSTSPVLRGTQSAAVSNSSRITHDTDGTYTEIYTFARYQFADTTGSASAYIYKNTDGVADFGGVKLLSTGSLACQHGTSSNSSANALTSETTYYIWTHFKASTGAGDGIMTATVSTTRDPDDAIANLGCSVTNGNDADTNIDAVFFGNAGDTDTGVSIDQILVSTSPIGMVCE